MRRSILSGSPDNGLEADHMTEQAILQLTAVLLGGLLATAGGIVTTLVIERRKERVASYHLALAFKGEIYALLQQIEERNYQSRIADIVAQIEQTGEPFHMPLRIRFQYDRVYDSNVERLGILKAPLPEKIPLFYTRLSSIMEDMLNLAEGTYATLDVPVLVRIYKDVQRLMAETIDEGNELLAMIDTLYPPQPAA